MTSPTPNPRGWLKPRQAKPKFRALPDGTAPEIRATEEGRCMARPTPCKARKTTNCSPVLEKPQESANTPIKRMPTSSTALAPTMSAIEPAMRSVAPEVSPYTDEGQRYKARSRAREFAISGNPTVIRPLVKLARKPTKEGMKIVNTI